ncbi:hypothetical protein [Bradyrhizobium sp. NP1]|uniref:hypothetical protein n=1 Tax=Bradyrhizobium sp. NP1 TaxID=3049772 RepID=UPI0025A5BBC2|nr:hypothetical protein [Bradyrhizobium sp. NP1]WJR79691.1 hypothetical protein QOU61_07935 [Bradyrhizobium sp. NP1]
MKCVFAVILGLLGLPGAALAQTPVAVVEDVQGKVTGAEFMDYVAPGQVIKLGAGGKVVLGYMKSCARETIAGIGTIIVGKEQSAVHLADYQVDKVACDVGQAEKIGREVSESAATVVRSLKEERPAPLVLYGTSPVVMTGERGKLVVERLDAKGERHEVELTASSLTRGRFYDFAKANTALQPGGTYAATLKSKRVVFQIDAKAGPGAGPVIGRLVSLR